MVTWPFGTLKPAERSADIILPCDSLIDESHSPITENVGMPGVTDISSSEMMQSVPLVKPEYILAIDGFPAMDKPPLYVWFRIPPDML